MRRTPLRKIGKVGRANLEARKRIAVIAQEKGLSRCEIDLHGCTRTWPLAPAHRHKRTWYKGDVELLSNFSEWVVACQTCHDAIEHNPTLTEEVFTRLRPKSNPS